jgi:hypothetical protein
MTKNPGRKNNHGTTEMSKMDASPHLLFLNDFRDKTSPATDTLPCPRGKLTAVRKSHELLYLLNPRGKIFVNISLQKIKVNTGLVNCQGKMKMSGFQQNRNVRFIPPPSAGIFV